MMPPSDNLSWAARVRLWLLLLAGIYCAYFLTLGYLPFSDGMENFNVLPSMELAREGNWLVPTLWGAPRLEKPPLAEWICAAGIRLGGPLEISARWPMLLLTNCTAIVVFEWGRMLGGWRAGLIAALALASSLFFVRFGRRAAYDAPLMFFVATTNLSLFWWLVRGRSPWAALAGGLALGGGMMTKGPPAVLHTLVPFAICAAWWSWRLRRGGDPSKARRVLASALSLIALIATISVICLLPWILAARSAVGGWHELLTVWHEQLTRANELKEQLNTPVLAGLVFFPLLMPWTGWLIGAAVLAAREASAKRYLPDVLIFALLPVVIHACVPPMRDRYLLPMLPAAAVAIGLTYAQLIARLNQPTRADHLLLWAHRLMLLGLGAGYPLILAWQRVMPWTSAALLAALCLAALIAAGTAMRRCWWGLPAATVIGMASFTLAQTTNAHAKPDPAQAIAQQILQHWPDAQFYFDGPKTPPRSLAIYLNKTLRPLNAQAAASRRQLVLSADAPENEVPAATTVMEFNYGRTKWRLQEMKPQE